MSVARAAPGLTRRALARHLGRSGAALLLAGCGLPISQARPRLIGYLGTNFATDPGNVQRVKDFEEGLRGQGLVEGRDVTVDFRWPEGGGHPWARAQTTELVGRGVSVIVVLGTIWRAVREVTDTVPIVASNVDGEGLVEVGWAASLAHPGGNITGLSHVGRHLSRKMIELLVECLPRMRRLALMSNLQSSPEKESHVRAIAQTYGLELLVLDVRGVDDVAPAFERVRGWRADAVTVDGLTPVSLLASPVATLAARSALPVIYYQRDYATAGGLMFFGGGQSAEYVQRRTAWYVARILGGTKPGDLPIEVATQGFNFGVNRRALALVGLALPPTVAMQVTEWID